MFLLCSASRVIQGNGFKHIRVDDYIMCVTFVRPSPFLSKALQLIYEKCFYTALMILIMISAHYATNLYPPEQESAILANPKDIADRVYGSKVGSPPYYYSSRPNFPRSRLDCDRPRILYDGFNLGRKSMPPNHLLQDDVS